MSWVILVLAGLFEIGWAIGLKYTDGFTKLWPSIGTLLFLTISIVLLGYAMKSIPLGSAYAIWVGIGVLGTTILGIFLLGDSADLIKLLSMAFIAAGVVGIKLSS